MFWHVSCFGNVTVATNAFFQKVMSESRPKDTTFNSQLWEHDMMIRKTALLAALVGALGLPMTAGAITIDGITFQAGSIFETTDLFEANALGGPISAAGQELVGIGIVNRILDPLNNVLWQNGDNGRELTIYFRSYIAQDAFLGPVGPGTDTFLFSGGVVELYSDLAQNFSAAGTMAAGIASASGGDLFLRLAGSPIGGLGSLDGSPITLRSDAVRLTGFPGTLPIGTNVTGTGLLDVISGDAASFFDTNTFGCVAADGAPCPDDADKGFTSSGKPAVGGSWAFRGTGEIQDFAIPEPGTVTLLGLALMGVGAGRIRRAQKKND